MAQYSVVRCRVYEVSLGVSVVRVHTTIACLVCAREVVSSHQRAGVSIFAPHAMAYPATGAAWAVSHAASVTDRVDCPAVGIQIERWVHNAEGLV